jgi:hypothetical protein
MNELIIKVPNSIFKKLQQLSKEEGISANQFVNSAIAEKISVLFTEEYMNNREKKASKEKYLKVLSKVKNNEPDDFDKIS